MIRFKQTIQFLAVAISLFVVSCNSDDSDPEPGPSDGQLIASVDGASFDSSDSNIVATLFNEVFAISALDPQTSEVITVSMLNPSVGTFDIGPNSSVMGSGAYSVAGGNAFLSVVEGGSGQLTITNLDLDNLLVSGSFQFVGVRDNNGVMETVTIEGGAFNNLPLTVEVVSAGDSSLNARVDGTFMNPNAVNAVEVTLQGNTTISISAVNSANFTTLGISMPADITPGTYDFDSLPLQGSIIGQYGINVGTSEAMSYISLDGSITITSYDPVAGTMEGTFFFTAGDLLGMDDTTFDITEGEFSVEIL
ncbi:MAG: DUF6252 family protein [Bacteroidota bacterium]